jgi:hypothetical protein
VLEVRVCKREPCLDLGLFLSGWRGCGVLAYCCYVLGQALGLVPGVCLFFEAFDAVGVDVGGAGFLGSRFMAPARLFGCFLVCAACALWGFAAQGDFLCSESISANPPASVTGADETRLAIPGSGTADVCVGGQG